MKYLACVMLASAAAADAAPPPLTQPQQPPLRQALQQYHPRATALPAPPPRQLSPLERAELRRQLVEYAPRRQR